MRALLEMLTLLLGAIPFTLAQVKAHAHAQAHEVRSPADVLSNLERDATSLEARDDDSYGGKDDHSGNGGWNGGPYQYKGYGSQDSDDGYGNGGKGESTSTIIVIETWEGTYGMSTVAAAGEHKTTIVNTMTNSALAATVSVSKGSGQQGGQASVQLSFVTTTVFQSAPAQTVTVTPMPQIITQTQMVTVTAPGTCSTTGLATGAAGATQPLAMSSTNHTMVSAMSVTSVMSVPTSILTATATSIGSLSVGSSGQVVKGTGVFNADGDCDCKCLCGVGSFPTYSVMAASPTATVPTTMQTMATSAGAQSVMSAGTLSTGTTSKASIMTSSSVSSASMAGTTMSMSSSSTTASSNVVFTLNPSGSSSTSVMSSPPQTATSSHTSSMSASAQPPLATGSVTTLPAQSAAAGFSIDVSTLSLSSHLVLGNLAAQATPGA